MAFQDWRPFLYGGIASITAEYGTFPIDTTKTRLQIQGQKIDSKVSELKYRGMLHAIFRISKEEGVKALYSGIGPAILRQATYGTAKIGIYYSLKEVVIKKPEGDIFNSIFSVVEIIGFNFSDETLLKNVFCGIIAGVISSSIANPTDVLKVRMQAKNKDFTKDGMFRSFVNIFKLEGIQGLWRGVGPTAQRAAVIAGVELPAYDITKKYFISHNIIGNNVYNHFVSSVVAGFIGAVASTPIDVVKTRLMSQRNIKSNIKGENAPIIYRSSLDCFKQVQMFYVFFE
ncbi:Kidney mitochondrial carrier protein 1 [Nymphon striatum]|nr:Kidney mitochondrial carrier protein 1 [Nymphon striatum]